MTTTNRLLCLKSEQCDTLHRLPVPLGTGRPESFPLETPCNVIELSRDIHTLVQQRYVCRKQHSRGRCEEVIYRYFLLTLLVTVHSFNQASAALVSEDDPNGIVGLSRTFPGGANAISGSWLVKTTITVAIDIKPGSDPNCFNINGHGVIPVAILGSADSNVAEVDLDSLVFGSFMVRMRGNRGPLCSIEFVNDDEHLDLVCHFEDDGQGLWEPNDNSTATLMGMTMGGASFEGTDSICVVP